MAKNCLQIIGLLGSAAKTAVFFGISPPSVHRWQCNNRIPHEQLIVFAARLEVATSGQCSRREQWPEAYGVYWPELLEQNPLVVQESTAYTATKNVAG